ncbi:U11/U12 small nuclear ribonucleoprotein 48 kDa protein [Raphanus sativus]|nr:U11/U12 small nuclear ribonucleoprotein 48 kDa protein [Raphanus sativus]
MPPEALFLHSLRCPKPIDLTHLLGSFTSEPELSKVYDFTGFGVNFFYKDCPGVVSFSGIDESGEQQILRWRSRTFECPVLVRVLSWLASQLAVLYGEGNGKFFALDMFKHCFEASASQIMLFRSPEDANFSNEDVKSGKALDTAQVISLSSVEAAVAALYDRSKLEGKIRAIRYAQPLTRYQRVAEHGVMTAKADEERKARPNYRPIIDHDGLPRQCSSNQDMNKMKTREELIAEERDYKRRRLSYRGKKVKRTPRQVLRDMIEGFTEEVKLAGGIGCFEKGMPLQSSSSIGNDQKESVLTTLTDASARAYKQREGENRADNEYTVDIRTNTDRGKRYEEYDSGSSQRQQSYRSDKSSDRRDDEFFTRTRRRSHERESYHHQNHRSSREKSCSNYKTKRDDGYGRRSGEPRKQNSFEDRYNPLERD